MREKKDARIFFAIWPDEETRNAAMGAVMQDPELGPKFADAPMDMRRMFFGAFEPIVEM